MLLSAFVPLSTDLYLPALPTMAKTFATTDAMMNMTLVVFFITFAIVSLVWGPLSDRFGRRRMLIIGTILYFVGSIFCAMATSVGQLIFFRFLQALGGGVTLTLSTAITRDVYTGRKQESILALVQSMAMIGPAIAPLVGGFILRFTDWRGMFWAQAVLGILVIIGSLLFSETIKEKTNKGFIGTFSRLLVVIKNPRFATLIPIFLLVSIGIMAFVTASSYIYQDHFGMTSQQYSYFFIINAIGMMAGPLLYVQVSKYINRNKVVLIGFFIMLIAGILVILFGAKGPWIFSLLLFPASFAGSFIRPPGTFLMLAQQKNDIGTAASLNICFAFIMGSIGMMLSTILPDNMILTIGISYAVIAIISGVLWIFLSKNYKE